jgi:toxin CcdB
MSQFDVHANPSRLGREDRPFLLVVQTRFLDHLKTRVCAPLIVEHALRTEPRLNPRLRLTGRDYYLSPTELVTLPVRLLGKPVANLEDYRDRIIAALDLVFLGI